MTKAQTCISSVISSEFNGDIDLFEDEGVSYDGLKDVLPLYLYHATLVSSLPDILQDGLEPRTKYRLSSEMRMTYLSLSADPMIALHYARMHAAFSEENDPRLALIRIPTRRLALHRYCPEWGSADGHGFFGDANPTEDDVRNLASFLRNHRVIAQMDAIPVDPSWIDLSWSGIALPEKDALIKEILADMNANTSSFHTTWSTVSRPAPVCQVSDLLPCPVEPELKAAA